MVGPKSHNDEEVPPSCQEMVACFPPLKVVEATGLVIYQALFGSVMRLNFRSIPRLTQKPGQRGQG